jgi:hypothetical protein
MASVTLHLYFWAYLDRGTRRQKAKNPAPPGVDPSLNVARFEPAPETGHAVGGNYTFNASLILRHAIWPIDVQEGKPQPHDWGFLFWAISGLKGGPRIVKESESQIPLDVPDDGADVHHVHAIAWYGTYGGGAGDNGVILDAYDVDGVTQVPGEGGPEFVPLGSPIDDDFVTVTPGVLDATKNANEVGRVGTDWKLNLPSCTIEAFAAIKSTGRPFKEWFLPEVTGDVKDVWVQGPDGIDVDTKVLDPNALRADAAEPAQLVAKKHVQGFAFAFYEEPPPQPPEPPHRDNIEHFKVVVNADGTTSVVALVNIYDPAGRLLVAAGTKFPGHGPRPEPHAFAVNLRNRLVATALQELVGLVDDRRIRRALGEIGKELMLLEAPKAKAPKASAGVKSARTESRAAPTTGKLRNKPRQKG